MDRAATSARTLLCCAAITGLAFAAATPACNAFSPNLLHCARNEGDRTCALYYPDGSRPFCGAGPEGCIDSKGDDGCVEERPPDDCYAACGGAGDDEEIPEIYWSDGVRDCEGIASSTESQTGTETDSESVGPATTPSSSTTGDPTTNDPTTATETTDPTETGPTGCMGDGECPADTPFCEDLVCVACSQTGDGNAACAGQDASTPLCVDDVCIQCTDSANHCAGTTPLCNEVTNTCYACSYHFECQDLGLPACHIAEGSCFANADVVNVNIGNVDALQTAIDTVPNGGTAVLELSGAASSENLLVNGNKTLAIISDVERIVAAPSMSASPVLTMDGGSTILYILNLSIQGPGTPVGVSIGGGSALYMDEARIVNHAGGSVAVSGDSSAFLRNCFIGGGNAADVPALMVNSGSVVATNCSVIAGFGDAPALECTGANSVEVRNAILMSRDTVGSEVACPGATVEYSATEGALGGIGNSAVGDMNVAWFTDTLTGDFHLQPGHPFADIAQWEDGDPPFDIDGDARPGVDGMPDVAGADVP